MIRFYLTLILILITTLGCFDVAGISAPDDFSKEISVFGVTIWATQSVSDIRLLHVGNVLAQYLDNNGDGEPDKTEVSLELSSRNATILMFASQSEAEVFNMQTLPTEITAVQFLLSSETNPNFNPDGINSYFDKSLEDVLNLITTYGYSNAWPETFGRFYGSKLADAMDSARGGYFPEVPDQYPENAWFTNKDPSFDYETQLSRYFYWALTSKLGAQDYSDRFEEIKDEWQLNTANLVFSEDPQVTEILSNPEFSVPNILPDGNYQGFEIEITDLGCST